MHAASICDRMDTKVSGKTKKQRNVSRSIPGDKRYGRSKISNGAALLPDVDGRSAWVRRLRDLINDHTADLGGPDNLSEGEKAIIRRASCLIVELEQMEQRFAVGEADARSLDLYQRLSNSMRRLLEAVGLRRRARDVTPTLEAYAREVA